MTDQPHGQLLNVDPAALIIGCNVRQATHSDAAGEARAIAASIRARGVLEAISCNGDSEDRLVVMRD